MDPVQKTSEAFWSKDVAHYFRELKATPEGSHQDMAYKPATASASLRVFAAILREIKNYLKQFTNPLMLLLIAAVILSALIGEHSEMLIILTIVLGTGTASYIQEYRAHRIVKKLQAIISRKCRVRRGGQELEIHVEELLRGDMVVLNAGDIIPADCLIFAANELQVNESNLTGESFPVHKEPGIVPESTPLSERLNCLWEGTSIISGSATALAIHVGQDTVFGSIIRGSDHTVQTTFDKGLKDFGLMLVKITLALSLVVLAATLYFDKPLVDSVLFALAL